MKLNGRFWSGAAVLLALSFSLFTSCVKSHPENDDPREAIRKYIAQSFSVQKASDRKAMEDFLGGEAKERLALWSDEQFLDAFAHKKRTFIRLEFKEVREEGKIRSKVTYEVSYLDPVRGKDVKVTSKKLATVERINDAWKIMSVMNLKELVEFQEELSLP